MQQLSVDDLKEMAPRAYLSALKHCSPSELPAEVLVQIYRFRMQHPLDDGSLANAALEQLFSTDDTGWRYIQFLWEKAARWAAPHNHQKNAPELFRVAIAHMIEVLPTDQGGAAEEDFQAFSVGVLSVVWKRQRQLPAELATNNPRLRDLECPPTSAVESSTTIDILKSLNLGESEENTQRAERVRRVTSACWFDSASVAELAQREDVSRRQIYEDLQLARDFLGPKLS